MTGLELEQRGEKGFADGTYSRPTGAGGGEFVDSNGKHWDIKEVHSDWPPYVSEKVSQSGRPFPNGFTEEKYTAKIEDQISKGRGVILDTSNTSQADIDSMRRIVEEKGWADEIIWYP